MRCVLPRQWRSSTTWPWEERQTSRRRRYGTADVRFRHDAVHCGGHDDAPVLVRTSPHAFVSHVYEMCGTKRGGDGDAVDGVDSESRCVTGWHESSRGGSNLTRVVNHVRRALLERGTEIAGARLLDVPTVLVGEDPRQPVAALDLSATTARRAAGDRALRDVS